MEVDEWQTTCSDLKQRGALLLKTEDWSDCTLLVGAEKAPLRAHKLMLAMASPVFESLFYVDSLKITDTFCIPDVGPTAFTALLNYIYTENINIHSFEEAKTLYLAANKYMIKQLACVCAEYLCWNLTMETACGTYEAASMCQDEILMRESLAVIKLHIQEILKHKSFEDIDIQTVAQIFSVKDLKVEEIELYSALERYVHVQNSRKRVITNSEETGQETKTRQSIYGALKHIRFLTLTVDQFASGPARSGLLTGAEALAILLNIAGASAPLPNGICDNRQPRYQRPVLPPPLPIRAVTSGVLRVRTPSEEASRRSAQSEPLELLHRPWVLRVLPVLEYATAGYVDKKTYLGLFLACERPDPLPWSCRVRAELVLSARPPGVSLTWRMDKTYTSSQNEWGNSQFVLLSTAVNENCNYLTDNHLVFEAQVSIVPADQKPSTSA